MLVIDLNLVPKGNAGVMKTLDRVIVANMGRTEDGKAVTYHAWVFEDIDEEPVRWKPEDTPHAIVRHRRRDGSLALLSKVLHTMGYEAHGPNVDD